MLYTLVTFFLFGFPRITGDEICLSTNEELLYNKINEVRKDYGLAKIPISKNLTEVAKLHVADLNENKPYDENICNPHSWSDKGAWKECCYRQDHSNPECMWKKPSEITEYEGDGYEIVAYWMSGIEPKKEISSETALQMWLESPGHSSVIFNKKTFAQVEWNAIGVAVSGNYASVWFGVEKDNSPPPQVCSN